MGGANRLFTIHRNGQAWTNFDQLFGYKGFYAVAAVGFNGAWAVGYDEQGGITVPTRRDGWRLHDFSFHRTHEWNCRTGTGRHLDGGIGAIPKNRVGTVRAGVTHIRRMVICKALRRCLPMNCGQSAPA